MSGYAHVHSFSVQYMLYMILYWNSADTHYCSQLSSAYLHHPLAVHVVCSFAVGNMPFHTLVVWVGSVLTCLERKHDG